MRYDPEPSVAGVYTYFFDVSDVNTEFYEVGLMVGNKIDMMTEQLTAQNLLFLTACGVMSGAGPVAVDRSEGPGLPGSP